MRKIALFHFHSIFAIIALVLLAGCGKHAGNPTGKTDLTVLAGSEQKTLQPIIDQFSRDEGVNVKVEYMGSVDIMMRLQAGAQGVDAVWPANSIWLALGDKTKITKEEQSVLWSPVVLAVKRSVATNLGWVGNQHVKVEDILSAAEAGKLRFMMTSATQSNSGASAYLGFLYAFSGNPGVLTADDLQKPDLQSKIKRILGSVNRSSGSSGWLKDLFLQKYDAYDAMVNYEAVMIEANQELVATSREPLVAVYPVDGQAIADSPFAYVDHNDEAKHELFKKLQAYLLSAKVQDQIMKLGRRVGPVGEPLKNADTAVFNPQWGIDVNRLLNQIRYPAADVLQDALDLYQTSFRKPSYTVYCLDFSGSMRGDREENLKSAMRFILDQTSAKQGLLQASPNDVTEDVIFSDQIINRWKVVGNDPDKLNELWSKINATEPNGGTDIFTPATSAIEEMSGNSKIESFFPAVILLTDGDSNTGMTLDQFKQFLQSRHASIPVFAIKYGEASSDQLKEMSVATSGRMFESGGDLTQVFREVKGYN